MSGGPRSIFDLKISSDVIFAYGAAYSLQMISETIYMDNMLRPFLGLMFAYIHGHELGRFGVSSSRMARQLLTNWLYYLRLTFTGIRFDDGGILPISHLLIKNPCQAVLASAMVKFGIVRVRLNRLYLKCVTSAVPPPFPSSPFSLCSPQTLRSVDNI